MEEKNVSQDPLWKKIKDNVLEFIKFAIIAAVIVLPIRMYIAQPFIVSGLSMFPTFNDSEYLIIDELSYNLGDPQRYDVSVFRYPKDHKKYFIKRIIGLPNETIQIINGKVTVFPCVEIKSCKGMDLNETYTNEPFATTATYTTGENEYFVLGDNRNYSSDSRTWGKVPKDLLVGRALVRLLPFNKVELLPGKIK